ncbi:unnamed protein product [Musa acuminata subsp. burmannicoides]
MTRKSFRDFRSRLNSISKRLQFPDRFLMFIIVEIECFYFYHSLVKFSLF